MEKIIKVFFTIEVSMILKIRFEPTSLERMAELWSKLKERIDPETLCYEKNRGIITIRDENILPSIELVIAFVKTGREGIIMEVPPDVQKTGKGEKKKNGKRKKKKRKG